jgi:hypothetical protein
MARREHEKITGDLISFVKHHSAHMTISRGKIGQFSGKQNLASARQELESYIADDPAQPVRTDMWFCQPEDLCRRSETHEVFQDISEILITYPGSKLAVGKGACAPLSELDIILRVQTSVSPESLHMPDPFLNRSPTLDYRRFQTIGGKAYRGKEPGGAHPRYNDFPVGGNAVETPLLLDCNRKDVGVKTKPFNTVLFIPYCELYRIDIADGRFLPRVKPFSHYSPLGDLVFSKKQTVKQMVEKLVLSDPEINGKVTYKE